MSEPAPKTKLSYAEYVRLEEASDVKHEYFDGEVFAMAGGTPDHSGIAMNVGVALAVQLAGRPCRVFNSDLRIRVLATGLGTYPDLSVVCGRLERDPEDANSITNPVLLVEVLSEGTEAYDRGEKFENYRMIPSLREYVLVSHRNRLVERYQRNEDGTWTLSVARAGERMPLASIDAMLDVDAVYADPLG